MSETESIDYNAIKEEWEKNPIRKPFISKVTVNISVGQSGEPLRRAMTILEALTKQKPVQIHAKRSIREWNIHKKEPIACKVTLRNEGAMNFLSKALEAIDNQLKITRFDKYGNFGFGIHEHITLEMDGSKYDPNLGIIGMDILVSFSRTGYRIAKRQYLKKKIPKSHRIKPEEAMTLLNQDFGVEIITSEEEDEL